MVTEKGLCNHWDVMGIWEDGVLTGWFCVDCYSWLWRKEEAHDAGPDQEPVRLGEVEPEGDLVRVLW